MDRRDFIKFGAYGLVGAAMPAILKATCKTNVPVHFGWKPDPRATDRYITNTRRPFLWQKMQSRIIGSSKGCRVLLYKYLERALGKTIDPHDQMIGDCVGQGYGIGVDTLSATQIHGIGLAEKFVAKASTEFIYAGSRYEIGYLRHGSPKMLRGDGSYGVYAAEFLRDYGALVRGRYGRHDLREYDARLARTWGREGVPDELEPEAKKHPIRSYALVRSYIECRDAIANGYPVIFCSSIGFNPECRDHNPGGRDSMGFLHRCGTWFHCMAGLGVDDNERPGVLIMNSWGPNWVGGPKRLGQPDGSFWVDAKTIDEICSQGDSFAISGFVGFPKNDLHYDLF